MPHEIILASEAEEDLKKLEAHVRTAVKEGIEKHLRHEPARLSKSRIKRLRGLRRPQYRLRIGEVRIFYDVAEGARSEEHTSELQSRPHLVCRLLLEKKKKDILFAENK